MEIWPEDPSPPAHSPMPFEEGNVCVPPECVSFLMNGVTWCLRLFLSITGSGSGSGHVKWICVKGDASAVILRPKYNSSMTSGREAKYSTMKSFLRENT